ncbi:MAG: hypothetical protein DRO23_12230 [Thermoprotei archaeon]|nr:MAG: hypothetical protein DRO23_12230 [Thermoprotei archaeon]
MKKIVNKLALFTLILFLYILFTGRINTLTIITGTLASFILALMFEKTVFKGRLRIRDVVKLTHIFLYIYHFIKAEIVSHVKIAKLILSRNPETYPAVIRIPFELENTYGIALLASSITNTPGTLTLHADKSHKVLYVHWLTAHTRDPDEAKKYIVGKLERPIKDIFG